MTPLLSSLWERNYDPSIHPIDSMHLICLQFLDISTLWPLMISTSLIIFHLVSLPAISVFITPNLLNVIAHGTNLNYRALFCSFVQTIQQFYSV